MKARLIVVLASVMVVSALVVAPAFGQTSGDGYSTPAGEVQADVNGGNGPPTNPGAGGPNGDTVRSASAAQLPFTGLDVGFLLAGGVVLLITGVGMSRLSRRSS